MTPTAEKQQSAKDPFSETTTGEVTRRAVRAALEPFKVTLDALAGRMQGSVESLDGAISGLRDSLERIGRQMVVTRAGDRQRDNSAEQLRNTLDHTRGQLAVVAEQLVRVRREQAAAAARVRRLAIVNLALLIAVMIGAIVAIGLMLG